MAVKPNLVIVESPSKAKTIEKYLGPDYTVKASMGHMRDLPKSKLGVDIDHGFIPQYEPLGGKETAIKDLSSAARGASRVYLATDPDREGEAIAWHLKEMLGLSGDKAQRVTFNEITKSVVNEAIASPRELDMALVNAQQARRVLDRLVGYQLSPLLWTKIKRGLSAGRVQSVVTRIVCDREDEIRAFVPEEYWQLDVVLRCENGAEFLAKFYGNGTKQQELHSKEETDVVLAAITNDKFSVKSVVRGTRKKTPPPPFETSTLQMEASRKLNFPSRKTMSVAQSLYEAGHITYMRTDSLRLSDEALSAAKSFITAAYGGDYHNRRTFKTKAGAQDAHEAIRPSYPDATPESLRGSLTGDEYKLYKLVWSRFTATQMSDAQYDTLAIDSISGGYVFRATESRLRFDGFLKVYQQEEDEEKKRLPNLSDGDPLTLAKLDPQQKWTQPPARYTEDSLIGVMKELGIGRPSTYAPTVSTIMAREYVAKNGKALEPTALGETVNNLMKDLFASVVDTHFTAEMETSLDAIADGKRDWQEVLGEFYTGFAPTLSAA
ncbi:MAG: type I DNA topoisomerase, partial [Oscillospiraceae bacterium]|nr:type I DNA topoisomerase [Oscillospiraceae bacterium]